MTSEQAPETFIIVEQITDTNRVIAYVKQCTLQEIKETPAEDCRLTIFALQPEQPPYSLYGGWRLHEIAQLEATDRVTNLTREIGNELRQLSKDQAMLLLDTIETRLRKAVAECREVTALTERT